jgi:hypothetical protein
VAVGELDPPIQRASVDNRIGVQDQDVFSGGLADAGVVAASEAEVGTILHYMDGRKLSADAFDRTVGRAIVGYDDLVFDSVGAGKDGL